MTLSGAVKRTTVALADVPQSTIDALPAAQGLVYLRLSKGAIGVSLRGGFGLVLVRRGGVGSAWSAPLAIELGSVGLGPALGVERSEWLLLFERKDDALAFAEGNMSLGLNAAAALGPFGVDGELLVTSGSRRVVHAMGWSTGLCLGASVELGGVKPCSRENSCIYGRRVGAGDIEFVDPPGGPEYSALYEALSKEEAHSAARIATVRAGTAASNAASKKQELDAALQQAQAAEQLAQRLVSEVKKAIVEAEQQQQITLALKARAARQEANFAFDAAARSELVAQQLHTRADEATSGAAAAAQSSKEQDAIAAHAELERREQEAADLRRAADRAFKESVELKAKAEQAAADADRAAEAEAQAMLKINAPAAPHEAQAPHEPHEEQAPRVKQALTELQPAQVERAEDDDELGVAEEKGAETPKNVGASADKQRKIHDIEAPSPAAESTNPPPAPPASEAKLM